jgi:hypothetical protein
VNNERIEKKISKFKMFSQEALFITFNSVGDVVILDITLDIYTRVPRVFRFYTLKKEGILINL